MKSGSSARSVGAESYLFRSIHAVAQAIHLPAQLCRPFASLAPLGRLCLAVADDGAQAGRGEREPTPLLTAELPEPENSLRRVTLDRLFQFFRNPAQWLLR